MDRPSILIVDDDEDLRITLAELLQDRGYRIDLAANGREALAHLHMDGLPALILLDLMMPGMDGRQFRAEQLKDPSIAQLPVVVMTAAGRSANEMTREMAPVRTVRKPFEITSLIDVIEETIKERKAR